MTVASIMGGGALLIAAYAFHVRARLLGTAAEGWPQAPVHVRWALDIALLPMVLAGLWWIASGGVPQWLLVGVSIGWSVYGCTLAVNIARQRGGQ